MKYATFKKINLQKSLDIKKLFVDLSQRFTDRRTKQSFVGSER